VRLVVERGLSYTYCEAATTTFEALVVENSAARTDPEKWSRFQYGVV
jgi:hypothetical protein